MRQNTSQPILNPSKFDPYQYENRNNPENPENPEDDFRDWEVFHNSPQLVMKLKAIQSWRNPAILQICRSQDRLEIYKNPGNPEKSCCFPLSCKYSLAESFWKKILVQYKVILIPETILIPEVILVYK